MEQPQTSPTDEQLAILDLTCEDKENIIVNALAGTGKTTTLKMMDKATKRKPILYLAFNRRVVDEVEDERKRASRGEPVTCFSNYTTVKTFNSIGHSSWGRAVGKNLKLDTKKSGELLKLETEAWKGDDKQFVRDNFSAITSALGLAKNLGYVPDGKFPSAKRLTSREAFHAALEEKPSPLFADLVDALLFKSIKGAYDGWIDFDDQVYMPTLFGSPFPRFPYVLVDEAQDLNPVNHEMLRRLVTGRLCAVGDRYQSIYAFRGAVLSGMDNIQSRFSCAPADLSISFRCPKIIVEAARWRVPHFKWVKPGGMHVFLPRLSGENIPEGAAVLCRNNAPLLRLAFGLLSCGRSVQLAGSDIGPRLIRLLQKIGEDTDDSETLCARIDLWANEKLQTSQSPGLILDQRDCLKIFATWGKNLAQAVAYAEHLFKQQGTIKLSTGHKAKGLEWDTVFHLDPWLCGDSEQDLNLKYVITTRAKQTLYEIDSDNIRW